VVVTSDVEGLGEDLALAHRLADAADCISLERFQAHDLEVSTKPDHSFVTDADRAVECALRNLLRKERPEDGILGEEYGVTGEDSRQWIIDPIDGTANYLRGVPIWGTLIALAVDRSPVLGVVSAPALKRRWWASRGSGAWIRHPEKEAQRLRVSRVASLSDASLSFQSVDRWDKAGYLEQVIALTRSVWRDRAFGDMWSFMLLAEGVIDIVAEFGVQPYDLAALIPIVEEAGGHFTSITGQPGPWHGSALATNGLLHEDAMRILQRPAFEGDAPLG
jgi:histidinol-phosphatase